MQSPGQRIYHLDALRCFCMLFGLLIHGATIGDNLLFSLIKTTSEHFRMATFFLVSGYFTAMVASRNSIGEFLKNRSRLILLPLVSGLLLLNPLTNWLVQLYHGGGEGFADYVSGGWRLPLPGPSVWHLHLWFLIALFVYALLTRPLLAIAGSRLAGRLVDRAGQLSPAIRLLALALLAGVMLAVLRGIADQLLKPLLPQSVHFLVQATFNYLVFFVAGLLAFRHRLLFETLHGFAWAGLLLFGAAYWLHPMLAGELPWALDRFSYWVARGAFIFLIVCALMAVARRLVTKGSPLLSRLTDGVYSFYIFHFLVIYLIANLMRPYTDNLYLTYLVILAVGYPLLGLIHERLIVRSPLLTLLFNGKIARRAALA
ncbi:MAG: acyltransferase family protein [Sandaracinobacteroides sp.]